MKPPVIGEIVPKKVSLSKFSFWCWTPTNNAAWLSSLKSKFPTKKLYWCWLIFSADALKVKNRKKNIVQKKGIKGRPDYLSYNKKNYSLSDGLDKSAVTLEKAIEIIEQSKKTKTK